MVHRWQLHDPSTSETYVFQRNPNKMTSPHPKKATTIFSRNFNFVDEKLGVGRVIQFRQEPYEWQFSGDIRTEAQYEDLRDWTRRVGRLELTDHFLRVWEVRFDSVEIDELRPRKTNYWRFGYTAKAIIYGRIS